jgi:predicted DNA-binding protein (MmcQ/YjbR family)
MSSAEHKKQIAAQLKRLRTVVDALPQAKRELKWEIDDVCTIHGKMFAIFMPDRKVDGIVKLWLKVDAERFLEFTDRPGVTPAPYLAKSKWIQFTSVAEHDPAELRALIGRSFDLIIEKLPKKHREPLQVVRLAQLK